MEDAAFFPFGSDPNSSAPPSDPRWDDITNFAAGGVYPQTLLTDGMPALAPFSIAAARQRQNGSVTSGAGDGAQPSILFGEQDPSTGAAPSGALTWPPYLHSPFLQASQPPVPAALPVRSVESDVAPKPNEIDTPRGDLDRFGPGLVPPWLRVSAPIDSNRTLAETSSIKPWTPQPTLMTSEANPLPASDNDAFAPVPAGDVQIAQAGAPSKQAKPVPTPKSGSPDSEMRLQVQAQEMTNRRVARASTWENVIRAPLPDKIPPENQQPLPNNWEGAVSKINQDYLRWTKAAAEKHGIPPELLARVFYKESTYDKNQVSAAGAKGIAQLMPGAVKEAGYDPNTFDYFNAEKSITAGAAHLAKYYNEFKDWPKAVAAYNMGNTALREWLKGDTGKFRFGPSKETQVKLQHIFRGDPYAFDRKPR